MKTNPELFAEQKYVYIPNAIPLDICKLASQYGVFQSAVNFTPGETLVVGSHTKYGDSLMDALLLHLLPQIEEHTGLKLYPTYSIYRTYKPGDVLEPHVDRPSCEISVTLCLGFTYKHKDPNYTWPIFVEGKEFSMNAGDMLIYRGLELEHWREPFEGEFGTWQVQVFLHYVNANDKWAFLRYDSRPSLAVPQTTDSDYILDMAQDINHNWTMPNFIYLTRGE